MANLHAVFEDAPRQGMPPENVSALKAYMAVRREHDAQEEAKRPVFTMEHEKALKPLPKETRQKLEAFIRSIPKIRFLKPDGKPNKEWTVFHGDTWAEAAARVVALAGERDRARTTAWAAAEVAARNEGRADAYHMLYSVIKSVCQTEAATDATFYCHYILLSDLTFYGKAELEAHVNARWNVWRKGYGLLGDVNGVFYVYAKK